MNTSLDAYRERVETSLRTVLSDAGALPLYGMLRYFMGYEDEQFRPTNQVSGKRIRPTLLLYIADVFGGGKSALDLAIAVELFHNFTLIHDDIEDHDELRRGRATVWKVWGVDHAINAGDELALLANQHLLQAAVLDPQVGATAAQLLNLRFMEVAEGQYLDFELAHTPLSGALVSVETYLEMIRKKTSVLLGAATSAGAVSAGCDERSQDMLFRYGESLGLAYQLADDISSIWGTVQKTGKMAYGDIVERKKTYPIIHAYATGGEHQARLRTLYASDHEHSASDIPEILRILEETGARHAAQTLGEQYVRTAKESARALPISQEQKETLIQLVDTFVQFSS